MDQTVLLIAKPNDAYFRQIEQETFNLGFQTLTVRSLESVLDRLDVEVFATIVLDVSVAYEPLEFTKQLLSHPFGSIAPIVLVTGDQKDDVDLFHGRKTIFDQVFCKSDIEASSIAEYLAESLKEQGSESKRGELGFVTPAALFISCERFGFVGSVSFDSDNGGRIIYFDDGFLTFASSSSADDFFGEFLQARDVIDSDQLSEALEEAKNSNGLLGDALVKLGFFRADKLYPLLQEHLQQVVLRTLTEKEGNYTLRFGEKPPAQNGIFQLPINQAIYQGVMQLFLPDDIRQRFGAEQDHYVLDPLFAIENAPLKLSDRERDVLLYLREPRSIEEVIQLSGLDNDHALKLLYVLNLLRICIPSTVKEAKAPLADEAKSNVAAIHEEPELPPMPLSKALEEALVQADQKSDGSNLKEANIVNSANQKDSSAQENKEAALPLAEKFVEKAQANSANVVPIQQQVSRQEQTESSFQPSVMVDPLTPTHRFSMGSFLIGFLLSPLLFASVYFGWNFWQTSQSNAGVLKNQNEEVAQYSFDADKSRSIAAQAALELSSPVETLQVENQPPTEKAQASTKNSAPSSQNKVAAIRTEPVADKAAKPKRPVSSATIEGLKRRAQLSYNEKRLDEALRFYSQALKLDKEDGAALIGMANIYFDLEQDRNALSYLKRALDLDRENAEAYLVLANIRMMQNNTSSASKAYHLFLKYSEDTTKKNEVRQVLNRIQR